MTIKYALIVSGLLVIFLSSTGLCQEQRLDRTDARPVNRIPRTTNAKPVDKAPYVTDIKPVNNIPRAADAQPVSGIPRITEARPVSSLYFLSIVPENNIYKEGDKIWINVTVTNTYEEDMNPYGYLQFGALNTNTKTKHGFSYRDMTEAGYEYIPDILWIDKTLKPSKSIERRIDLSVFNDFPKGEYNITFTFVPWEENENPLHKTVYLSNPAKIKVE